MNEEEFKKYVNEMNKSIANKLKDNEEELAFYIQLVNRFNDICDEKVKLENALDEIEKYIENHKRESESHIYGLTIPKFIFDGDIEDVEEIIEKVKGE